VQQSYIAWSAAAGAKSGMLVAVSAKTMKQVGMQPPQKPGQLNTGQNWAGKEQYRRHNHHHWRDRS